MIRHIYTLQRISEELKILTGCTLEECFTQEKDTCIMVFSGEKKEYYLQFSADTKLSSVFLRKNFRRAKKNTVNLFPDVTGEVLQDISVPPNDRIIRFQFSLTEMTGILFGGAQSNLFAVSGEGIIFDALKDASEHKGKELVIPAGNLKSFDDFSVEAKIIDVISKNDLLLGKDYGRELCTGENIIPDKKKGEFSADQLDRIKENCRKFRKYCLDSGKAYILENKSRKRIMSLIPLQHYPEIIREEDSVSDAVYRRVVDIIVRDEFEKLYSKLEKDVSRKLDKLHNSISQVKSEKKTKQRADRNRLYAELLMAQRNPRQKGMNEIKLSAWDGTEVTIPLDEKKTLLENAEKYFDKARSADERIRINRKRLPELQLQLAKTEKAAKELENTENLSDLRELENKIKLITGKRMQIQQDESEGRFRVFELGAGYVLYVGKNARNNDELTMKFAKPHDIWLHARGAGGSHAVLRSDKKQQKPPKEILQKAAMITAYYSQARNSKYAPVAYTEKKYVRKPKGANPGTVTIAREEVIMVNPGLPE